MSNQQISYEEQEYLDHLASITRELIIARAAIRRLTNANEELSDRVIRLASSLEGSAVSEDESVDDEVSRLGEWPDIETKRVSPGE